MCLCTLRPGDPVIIRAGHPSYPDLATFAAYTSRGRCLILHEGRFIRRKDERVVRLHRDRHV